MNQYKKLAAALIAKKLLSVEQLSALEARIATDKGSFSDAVREAGLVSAKDLALVKAEIMDLPFIDLAQTKIDGAAMQNISRQAAATYRFFAFNKGEGKLEVAMESPEDFQALEAVKFIAKKQGVAAKIFVTDKEAIDKALGGAVEIQAEIGSALRDFGQELAAVKVTGKDTNDLERYIEEAPVTKVVAVIIRHAIEGSASDIHIEPTFKDVRIRYRIDGNLYTSLLLPLRVHAAIVSRVKILAHLKIDEARLPQDGRFSSQAENRSFDFRVSTMPTVFGEKVVLRILDKSQGAPSFDELGLQGPQQKIYQEYLQQPHGIILITGPTGAGKSTTLFTSLSSINTPAVNISTLEDPVEYEIAGVNQTQINPDIGLNFASGLRNMLRQDPDIMMVGEIRDRETAALAVHASLTGHLVLSTLHTNDAIGAIPRLVDMGIDPYLLTATLRMSVAQRLVARLCQSCKKEQPLPDHMREQLEEELAQVPAEYKTDPNQARPEHLFVADGCPACHESGTAGRFGIFEVVPITRALRDVIGQEAKYDTLYDAVRSQGHITMRQDGLLKALVGQVLLEDVIRVTSQEETKATI